MQDVREFLDFGNALSVNIRGRVVSCRTYRGRRYTVVLSPAVDAYSNPQAFEIRSRANWANKDQDVSCNCLLSGSVMPLDELQLHRSAYDESLRPLGITLDLCETVDDYSEL